MDGYSLSRMLRSVFLVLLGGDCPDIGRFIADSSPPGKVAAGAGPFRHYPLPSGPAPYRVCVVAGWGVVGHVPYASPPTKTSTMPRVIRFQVASPTVRRVSPRYGPLSETS
jgi:hypothetical protein